MPVNTHTSKKFTRMCIENSEVLKAADKYFNFFIDICIIPHAIPA